MFIILSSRNINHWLISFISSWGRAGQHTLPHDEENAWWVKINKCLPGLARVSTFTHVKFYTSTETTSVCNQKKQNIQNVKQTCNILHCNFPPEVERGRVGNSIKTSLLINESRYNQIYNITSQLTKDHLLFIRYLRKWRMCKRSHRAELSHVPLAAARTSASTTRCMMLGACAIILQTCNNFVCVGGRWESGFQHLQLKLLF